MPVFKTLISEWPFPCKIILKLNGLTAVRLQKFYQMFTISLSDLKNGCSMLIITETFKMEEIEYHHEVGWE